MLPMDQLLSALQDKLDARLPGNQFSWGYRDHSLTSAVWTLSRQRKELLETYQRELSLRGAGAKRIQWTPALRFLTSDIGISSAKVFALLEGGKCLIHIGSCVAVDHRHKATVEDFQQSLDQLFAGFQDSVDRLRQLLGITLEYPVNAMTRVCKKLRMPKKAALEAIHQFEQTYGGGPATAHDVFLAMEEIPFLLRVDHTPETRLFAVEEHLARALTLKWEDYDLAKGVEY